MIRRAGILTASRDAPGLNTAIHGFGRVAVSEYKIELIGFLDGIKGLAENRLVTLDSSPPSGILTQEGIVLGTSRDKVHRIWTGESEESMSEKILKIYERNKLDIIVVLGGGGIAKNALRLQEAGINVVHLPKTIDNDIWGIDNSINFAIALEIATEAVDRLHSTIHSHHRITLMEIMGHRAGWLALGAGITGGTDIILIPETPYNIEKVIEKIEHRKKLGRHFSAIVIAKDAMDMEYAQYIRIADQLVKDVDSPETKALAKHNKDCLTDAHHETTFDLACKLGTMTGLESRVTILGYMQRGGTPVGADCLLTTRLGVAGIAAVTDGVTRIMVATERGNAVNVPLEKIAGKVKFVPTDHEWVKTAQEVETELGGWLTAIKTDTRRDYGREARYSFS